MPGGNGRRRRLQRDGIVARLRPRDALPSRSIGNRPPPHQAASAPSHVAYDAAPPGQSRFYGREPPYHVAMPLQCNIDARGKLARLIYGLVLVVLGAVLLIVWALPAGGFWPWAVTVMCLLGGAFAIFEARAGWCVMRAMGFRTPM